MNLQELISPLPKLWLNINANSLNAKSISSTKVEAGVLVSVNNLSYDSLTVGNNAGPFTIDADSMINGIFSNTGNVASVINLPSAAAIGALFPSDITLPITFEFKVFSKLAAVIVNLGAGCLINGGSSYTSAGNNGSVATFYGNASGFTVYAMV